MQPPSCSLLRHDKKLEMTTWIHWIQSEIPVSPALSSLMHLIPAEHVPFLASPSDHGPSPQFLNFLIRVCGSEVRGKLVFPVLK